MKMNMKYEYGCEFVSEMASVYLMLNAGNHRITLAQQPPHAGAFQEDEVSKRVSVKGSFRQGVQKRGASIERLHEACKGYFTVIHRAQKAYVRLPPW